MRPLFSQSRGPASPFAGVAKQASEHYAADRAEDEEASDRTHDLTRRERHVGRDLKHRADDDVAATNKSRTSAAATTRCATSRAPPLAPPRQTDRELRSSAAGSEELHPPRQRSRPRPTAPHQKTAGHRATSGHCERSHAVCRYRPTIVTARSQTARASGSLAADRTWKPLRRRVERPLTGLTTRRGQASVRGARRWPAGPPDLRPCSRPGRPCPPPLPGPPHVDREAR